MKNIYLIRHGRQAALECNVDAPLSVDGVRQATLLAQRLCEYDIDVIYTSDLLRAKETAKIIQKKIVAAKVTVLPEWKEIDFGALTGHTDEYIKEHYGEFRKERARMTSDLAFPDGECGQDVINRILDSFEEMIKKHDKNILIVTHGGVIRSFVAYLLNMNLKDKLLLGMNLENTGITQLRYDEERQVYTLERFNDYAHLEPFEELQRDSWKPLTDRM